MKKLILAALLLAGCGSGIDLDSVTGNATLQNGNVTGTISTPLGTYTGTIDITPSPTVR